MSPRAVVQTSALRSRPPAMIQPMSSKYRLVKALQAFGALAQRCFASCELDVGTKVDVFRCLITSILLNGAETWTRPSLASHYSNANIFTTSACMADSQHTHHRHHTHISTHTPCTRPHTQHLYYTHNTSVNTGTILIAVTLITWHYTKCKRRNWRRT